MQKAILPYYEADILSRLFFSDKPSRSQAAADVILALEFDQTEKDRMHELAAKAQAGILTPKEQAEVEAYSRVGSLLGILQSKARRVLKGHPGTNGKSKIH